MIDRIKRTLRRKFIQNIEVLGRWVSPRLVYDLCGALLRSQGIGAGSGVGRAESALLHRLLPSRPLVIDAGGHVGAYSRAVFNCRPEARVHIFEPSGAHMQRMRSNLERFGDRIHLNQAGLSDTDGEAVLYKDSEISGLASLTRRDLDFVGLTMSVEERVHLTTLDKYWMDREEHIDLLKLDVEGHELSALMGAEALLSSGRITYIQLEFGGANLDTRTPLKLIWAFLRLHGYHLSLIRPRGDLAPLGDYHEIYEQYATTNFVAARPDALL